MDVGAPADVLNRLRTSGRGAVTIDSHRQRHGATIAPDQAGLSVPPCGRAMLLADRVPEQRRQVRVQVQAPDTPWEDSHGRPITQPPREVELADTSVVHDRVPPVKRGGDLDLVPLDRVVEETGIAWDSLMRALGDGRLRQHAGVRGPAVLRRDVEQLADGASESDLRATTELLGSDRQGPTDEELAAADRLLYRRTSSVTEAELDDADRLLWGGRSSWRR